MNPQSLTYHRRKRKEVAIFLPRSYQRVLEVGCGGGGFAENLNSEAEKWGVELDPFHAKEASKVMDHVLEGPFEKVKDKVPDQSFDLVICNDIIEHMPDHDQFFEDVKKKLKPGGILVGSIPNVRHIKNLYEILIKRDWEYVQEGTLDKTHLRFFTEKSIKRSLKKHQFKIEKFHGLVSSEVQISWMRKILKRLIFTLITILSLGFYSDIQYLQFGFRAKI